MSQIYPSQLFLQLDSLKRNLLFYKLRNGPYCLGSSKGVLINGKIVVMYLGSPPYKQTKLGHMLKVLPSLKAFR